MSAASRPEAWPRTDAPGSVRSSAVQGSGRFTRLGLPHQATSQPPKGSGTESGRQLVSALTGASTRRCG
jgi:hypothetical protein